MACLWKRGKTYYARYYAGTKQRAVSLGTSSHRVAKEKLRQLESSLAQGTELSLPTKTPVAEVVAAYIDHIEITKTRQGFRVDVWYLRDIFGPICPALERKLPGKTSGRDGNAKTQGTDHLVVACLEQVTTPDLVAFLSGRVRSRRLSPKTANNYRAVLSRLFSWAMDQYGVRMPDNQNPAAKVERYRQQAHTIRFLTLEQIDDQIKALEEHPLLRVMTAVYIYAGLRREEALWLTRDDVELREGKFGVIRVRAKTIEGEYWEPKTKVNRVVPISRSLLEFLETYTPRSVPGPWYFPSPVDKRWDPDYFSEKLRNANKQAGLPWSCLDFRHTFGSQLAMKGESLYKIATLMGNSPEICRRHYAALMPESLIDSVEFASPAPAPPVKGRPRLHILPKNEEANRARG